MSSSDIPRLFGSQAAERPMHTLRVSAGDPLAEAFISNGALDLVARGQHSVEATLPEGTYLVKFREGNQVTEQWVNLTSNIELLGPPEKTAAAPVPRLTDARQQRLDAFLKDKTLAVIVTDPEGEKADIGEVTLQRMDGQGGAWRTMSAGSVAAIGGISEPGWYVLRVSTPGVGSYEMCVWVAPGFDTRVHLTRRIASVAKKQGKTPHFGTASISMPRRGGLGQSNRVDHLAKVLTAVLNAERPLLPSPDVIDEALHVKGDDLMVGLMAAHVLHLHITHQTPAPRALEHMREAVGNLLRFSKNSPDAGALGITYGVPTPGVDFGAPPMLAQSAQIIAAANQGTLVPLNSLAARVAPALTAVRPWLVWRTRQVMKAPADVRTIVPVELLSGGSMFAFMEPSKAAGFAPLFAGRRKKAKIPKKKIAAKERKVIVHRRRLAAAKAGKKQTR